MHPAGMNHIPSFLCLLIEGGNIFGPVLKVAVHHDDIFTLGIAQSSRNGVMLAEVAAQIEADHTLIDGTHLTDGFPHIVGRTVIHEDNLVTIGQRLQRGVQTLQQFRKHRLPAILRDDYRYLLFLLLFHIHLKSLISRTTVSASSRLTAWFIGMESSCWWMRSVIG